MRTVSQLIAESLRQTELNILIFGPQTTNFSSDPRILALQHKRIEIRQALQDNGYFVKDAEELVDRSLPPPMNNIYMQEKVLLQEFDIVVVLVETPGTQVELGLVASRPDLAAKACIFLSDSYLDGFAAEACAAAAACGADYSTYRHPDDLRDCHLLGKVREKIDRLRFALLMA
jgi:hypothetical protein